MERVTLGRTGLKVSVAGLGCGGHSRLGQGQGHSFEQSVEVVRAAIDHGVNFIDTAAAYGTEEIVGAAVKHNREQVVISSKQGIVPGGASPLGDVLLSGPQFAERFEGNLRRLGTDYIDILHLHGVMAHQYAYCKEEFLPVLLELQKQGKIRCLGLTERFIHDTDHQMLQEALRDNYWDVVMTGFNLINPSARKTVLPAAYDGNVGVLIMFAVRRALSRPDVARALIQELVTMGDVDASHIDEDAPLDFLLAHGGAEALTEAAYRFCRHEPGAHVVLTGTGSISHLEENLRAIAKGPLPIEVQDRLKQIFGDVQSVSGN